MIEHGLIYVRGSYTTASHCLPGESYLMVQTNKENPVVSGLGLTWVSQGHGAVAAYVSAPPATGEIAIVW